MLITLLVAKDDDLRRLDRILRKVLPELPLSAIHRLIRTRAVRVDGKPAAPSSRPQAGSCITLPQSAVPAPTIAPPSPAETTPFPLPILWEGAGMLAVHKPAGLAVHGPESLETLVRSYLMPRLPASLSFRPGPLHRLDTPTSGIILFSTTLQGAQYFSTLIREHQVRKTYLAVVEGELTRPCTWKDALVRDRRVHKTRIAAADGPSQDAETQVVPLAVERGYTLIQARIPTGRTHQIRAQAAFHGHPLRGDRKYRGGFHAEGLLLHAYTLEFPLDAQGQGVPRLLTAPPSERFCKALGHLFGKHPLQDISDAPWDPRPE